MDKIIKCLTIEKTHFYRFGFAQESNATVAVFLSGHIILMRVAFKVLKNTKKKYFSLQQFRETTAFSAKLQQELFSRNISKVRVNGGIIKSHFSN